jgi:DNA-binding protein HU-beta
MVKADLINLITEVSSIPRAKASLAVETIFESMKEALREGKRIELRGFGVFEVRNRKQGIGRNPKTGVEVPISPGKTVRFKPGKDLREI